MKRWKKAVTAGVVIAGMVMQPLTGFASEAGYDVLKNKEADYESGLQDRDVAAPGVRGAAPNLAQLKYYQDETSAFIHFGINTFTGDEWSDGTRDPKLYAPTEVDTDQWVRILKAAGFNKIILTAKHHDGFQLWPSKYSTYNVANSGDKNKTDVLAELSKSCTEQNVDMGLYMSPWDRHEPSYGVPVDSQLRPTGEPDTNGDYNLFYLNQLEEILANDKYGNNGHFSEIWMDGAKRGNAVQPYALQDWWEYCREQEIGPDGIKGTADDVLLFNNIGEDIRWVGNESGYSYDPIWPQVNKTKLWNDYNYGIGGTPENPKPAVPAGDGTYNPAPYEDGSYLTQGQYDGDQWNMPEADFSIIGDWFYKTGKAPISGVEIAKRYFQTVGNGTPMLLNVPPNKDGKIEESYVNSLVEYRDILDNTFRTNLSADATAFASNTRGNAKKFSANQVLDQNPETYWSQDDGKTTGDITVELNGEQQFDLVDIREYIELGQNISDYSVEVRVNGEWQPFGIKNYTGDPNSTRKNMKTIGARSLVRGYTVNADAVRLNINGSYGVPSIREIGVYKMDPRIEYSNNAAVIPRGLTFLDSHSAVTTGSWDKTDSDTYRENSMVTWDPNATATYQFTGSKFYLSSRHSWNFGAMEVTVDGGAPFLVDLYSTTLDRSVLVYESGDLPYKEHRVLIKPHTSPTSDKPTKVDIATDGLIFLNNEGRGMLELNQAEAVVNETDALSLTIKRTGGSSGEVSVHVQTDPGSAVQGDAFEPLNTDIVFKDGETEKTVTVQTLESLRPGDLDFYVKLTSPQNTLLGFVTKTTVTIINKDKPVDKNELNSVIRQADGKQKDDYSSLQWRQLKQALSAARAVQENQGAGQAEVDSAVADLRTTLKNVRPYGSYMDLFTVQPVSMEAEDADLGSGVSTFLIQDYPAFAEASGTGLIGDISEQGGARVYFNAPQAGSYELTVDYFSRNDSNKINWTNGKQGDLAVAGTMSVKANASGFDQVKTNIEIKEKGMQYLEFIKPADADSPNLDKFTIQYIGELNAPEGISVTPADLTLNAGTTQALTPAILPADSSMTDIHWFVEDGNIASVDQDGIITGIEAGTTTVYAVTDNSLEASVNVTVMKTDNRVLKELIESFLPERYTTGSWQRFAPALEEAMKALDSDSQDVLDQAVIVLNQAAGQLEDRITSDLVEKLRGMYDQYHNKSGLFTTNSFSGIQGILNQIQSILNSQENTTVKEAEALTARFKDLEKALVKRGDFTKLKNQYEMAKKLNYKKYTKASGQKVLKLYSQIDALLKNTNAVQKDADAMYANLAAAMKKLVLLPTSIKLTGDTKTLGVNEKLTLKVLVKPQGADSGKLKYKSSNPKTVSVDSRGRVQARKTGTATITVTSSYNKKSKLKITVKKAPLKVIMTASKKKIKVKKTLQLKTTLTKGSAGKVTYSSSNKKIASVTSKGKVTGLKKGRVTITAKTYNGKKGIVKLEIVK